MGFFDAIRKNLELQKDKKASLSFYVKYGDLLNDLQDQIERNNEKAVDCEDPLKAEKYYNKAIDYAQKYKELCFAKDGGIAYYNENPAYSLESIQAEYDEIKDEIGYLRNQKALKKRIRTVLLKKIKNREIEYQKDLKNYFPSDEINEAKRVLDECVKKGDVLREKSGSTYRLTVPQ